MTVVAALTVGLACALAAGAAVGALPQHVARGPSPRAEQRRVWLQQSGLAVTPAQFAAGSVAAGAAALVGVAALTGSLFVGIVPAIALASVPRVYFGRRRRRRLEQVQHAWPDGLRDLLASITAGRSLTQAVAALADTGPSALREAFFGFPSLARSLGTVAALEIVKEELADPTSDRVIEVLVIAHDRGGGIVRQILEDLVDATTKDLRLRDALETEALEMRINARAVVVLPWLVLVALTARPGPFRDFYRSGAGLVTLMLAGLLTAIGIAVLGRLGREHPEPRVFGAGIRP